MSGVVSRLPRGAGVASLTFDACGGPGGSGVDHELLDLLRRLEVPATLFLNERWVAANPAVARGLADDPLFELGNHGHHHRPLSVTGRSAYGIRGTRGPGEVYDEVTAGTPWFVEHTGAPPRWFRPGTAYCDEVGASIARELGEPVAGFTVNADAGATASRAQIGTSLRAVRRGDVVLAHLNQPGGATAAGFADELPRLLRHGPRLTTLSAAIPAAGATSSGR